VQNKQGEFLGGINMRTKKCILVVCLLLTGLLFSGGNVFANDFKLLDRNFHINGFFMQELNYGAGNAKYDGRLTSAYTTFQVEWSYQISDSVSLYSINRVFGDWAWDIHHGSSWWKDANFTAGKEYRARKKMQWEWDQYNQGWESLRELYLDINLEKWSFRLGKQQVVWGETDGLRLMDIINPQDLRRQFILRDSDEGYEHTRIPLWLIKIMYFPGWEPMGIRDLQFEFVLNPGKVRQNRLNLYYSDGGLWTPETANVPKHFHFIVDDKRPSTRLDRAEFGLRIMGDFKDWIFTLNGFYGTQIDHALYLKPGSIGLTENPRDGRFIHQNYTKEYGWMKILGFTLNRELEWIRLRGTTSPVLRVESLYEFSKYYQNEGDKVGDAAWTGLNPKFPYKRDFDEIRTMLGIDWNIYIRPLNKRESFFCSAQFFLFYIRKKDGELVNAPFYYKESAVNGLPLGLPHTEFLTGFNGGRNKHIDPWRVHQTQKYGSLMIQTQYFNKRIVPTALFVYDFEEHGLAIKSKLNFNFGSHWRPELGFLYFRGDHDTGKFIGLFQKNSEVYMKIKYQF